MSQFFSPRNLVRVLRRRALVLMLVLAVGVPLSVWFALRQPRLYEAIAVIQIESPEVADALTRTPGGSGPSTGDIELELIQQKLMSRDQMSDLIDRLGLFADTDHSPNDRVGLLRGAVSIEKLIDPSSAFRPDIQASGLIITVRLGDPQQAADVANDILHNILTQAQSRSQGRAARTLDFFVAEESRVTAEILAAEADLATFKQASAASLPDNIASQRDRLRTLRESGIVLDQQLIGLETTSERLRVTDVDRQRTLLQQQRALIDTNIAGLETALAAAPEVERQLSALDRRRAQLDTELGAITASRTNAAMLQLLESQDQAERFEVLETALVPDAPISASRRKIAMAGVVATALAAAGVAMLLEWSNPAIRNAAQLEAQLGLRAVVTIPHLRSRGQRTRRRLALVALVLAALGGVATVAWWFNDRLVELVAWAPWSRLRDGAGG